MSPAGLPILGCILGCILAAAPAMPTQAGKAEGKPPEKADDVRGKLVSYLATHDVPALAELRTIAGSPEASLMSLAEDAGADHLVRARAVAALRLLPSAQVRDFLGKLVETKAKAGSAVDKLIVRRAAIALGWISGPRAHAQLVLLFENEDPEVRVDAAIGLGLTRAPEAPVLLRRQLAVEAVARVRDQIERQLRALGEPTNEPAKPAPRKERTPMRAGF